VEISDFQARNILSSSYKGHIIRTIQLRYPRMIHSEFMTHRVFSRNARSSRAVPVKTLLNEEIYVPQFMKNKPGMQSNEYFSDDELMVIEKEWKKFAKETQKFSQWLSDKGVHKQWANRPLEWFGYIDVLVTSDKWKNFFELRLHPDAQTEIREVAKVMDKAIADSEKEIAELKAGEWHIPYNLEEEKSISLAEKLNLSVARCARVSYTPFDGNSSYEKEFQRASLLRNSDPIHASAFEHQAYVAEYEKDYSYKDYDHERNTHNLPFKFKSNFDFSSSKL
jgi:hypothetical protein